MFDWLKDIWHEVIKFFKFWEIIEEYQMGVRLTLGRFPKQLVPGFHFIVPFGIHVVHSDNIKPDTLQAKAVHVTTMDGKTVSVSPAIEYEINNIIDWLIYTNDARTNLHDIIRGITADYITDISWEECGKKTTRTAIKNKLNKRIESMGAVCREVMLTDICISRVIVTAI